MGTSLRTATLLQRGVANLLASRPLCASFEITHHCNARCRHCHRGEKIREVRAPAERFGELYRQLRPPVVMVSGGEPTTRGDLEEILKAIRQPDGTPYLILTTNGSLLTRDRFYRLRYLGVDQFSISLDFPDDRHDEFRGIPGLFAKIRSFILSLVPEDRRMVTLNAVVMSRNIDDLVALAELARDWNVSMNYSPYTWLRTNDRDFLVKGEELRAFEAVIERLIAFRRQHDTIRTSDAFLYDMARFFEAETLPGCRAGERFIVVNPDGTLSPCGLIMAQYASRDEVVRSFSKTNTCAACNTCIRASTEHPFNHLVAGGMRGMRPARRRKGSRLHAATVH
ncbi:MAG: radical SAM protein [Gemmatimonadota bacterium]